MLLAWLAVVVVGFPVMFSRNETLAMAGMAVFCFGWFQLARAL